MALIQHMESAGSPEKSAERAALNSGVNNDIGVGGLGGTGLLGVDCLLMPKGQVGTVGVNNIDMRLGSRDRFSSSLESGWAEKPLWVLQWEMSNGEMFCSWIGGTDGHS